MIRRHGITVLLLSLLTALAAGAEGRFFRSPDIRGTTLVFTYEGDLWTVTTDGATATRLTSHPGTETAARISPDGTTIAFTGSYDGSNHVYLMPLKGGEPERLTYLPTGAQSICWTPDGSRVVFRSMFDNANGRDANLYFVNKAGGSPERFPIDRGVLCSFSADGTSILYCRRGMEEYYWKRYKGGQYQDIWRYDFDTRTFTPISDYVGKNSYPMWVGSAMYFVSDRTNGIANLYKQDLTTREVTQITRYSDFDVMMPATDGTTIVYVQNGYLHLYTIATGRDQKLSVTVPSDRWRLMPRTIDAKEYLHAVDLSQDGKTLILEARGDIFRSPTGDGPSVNLSATPGTREMHSRISPDGKWIAFFSDKSGEYQLYVQSVDGGAWKQLTTSLDRTVYRLVWSPDGNKILFGTKDFAIYVVDITTHALTKIDASNQMKNDEFYWEIDDYAWSPDSKWVTYSLVQFNRNSQVFLYSLEQGKRFPVTDDFYDNLYPRFDAGGKYLYYISSRDFALQMDFYEDNHVIRTPHQVMVVQLADGEQPPFADAVTPGQKSGTTPNRIDVQGFARRTYPLPVPAGNYFYLKAGKGKVAWCSVPMFTEDEYEEIFKPGGDTKWELHIFDMETRKETVLPDKVKDFLITTNGEQLLTMREKDLYVAPLDRAFEKKTAGEKVPLGVLPYTVDQQKEWNQIFSDTWRWYRDFFYDAGMHGRDWKAMGDAYRAYLPSLSSRDELNWVLQQMVGELCVSHTYIGGGDMGPRIATPSQVFTGWLGADLTPDVKAGAYRIDRLYGPSEYNLSLKAPLARPDIDVKEGYYLVAINDEPLQPPDDYHRRLQVTPGQKVKISISPTGTRKNAKTYEVTPIRYDPSLRYHRWLTDNVNYVLQKSGGKVGYMHITAMGAGGVGQFDKFWRAFRYKEGLIIDVRRNSGGWTEYFMIDKLERRMVAHNVLRGMVPFRYPGSVASGHLAVVSNENNGSDGEAFVEHFKARKLGTVVGTPSWGGLVGILNGQRTVDNGTVQQSNNAFYGSEGKWLVENHGADPDVLIDNDPASVMAGRDAQLDRALEIVLTKIQETPFTFPPVPPYPKR